MNRLLPLRPAVPWLLTGWLVLVGALAGILAAQSAGVPLLGQTRAVFWDVKMLSAAAAVFGAVVGAMMVARRLRPPLTLPVGLGVSTSVVVGGALVTGQTPALVPVFLLFAGTWIVGDAIVGRLGVVPYPAPVRHVISIALGNGLLGLALLLLGSIRALNTLAFEGAAVVLCVALVARWSRRRPSAIVPAWLTDPPSWPQTGLLAMALAMVSFALLQAFVPETASDAIGEHLPIAREAWQHGSTWITNGWNTAELPIHAQVMSVPLWGYGGDTAVKLMHALVGLVAASAVAALARVISGRAAAILAAVLFLSLPIFLWEIGHAYVDLYPVMFAVTGGVALLIWQRTASWHWLVVAGALAGFCVAAKLQGGVYAAALGLSVLLVGRGPWSTRDRLASVLAFAVGTLVLVPWVLRSFVLTGSIVGLELLPGLLGGQYSGRYGSNLASFGIGRSPLSLLAIPWDVTIRGDPYGEAGFGSVGVAILLAMPFLVGIRRTRQTALVTVIALASYLGWAYTAQYLRYGLPLLAFTCALVCAGVVGVARRPGLAGTPLIWATTLALFLTIAAAPLLWLPKNGSMFPVGMFLGRTTRSEHLSTWVHGYEMLAAASRILPENGRVGWIGDGQFAQIYAEVLPTRLFPADLGESTSEVLDNLDAAGVRYFIWDRPTTPPSDWRTTLLSTSFLRGHTRLIDGAAGAYLFELGRNLGSTWETDSANLIPDATVTAESVNGQVTVAPGLPYLLTATASCDDASSAIVMYLGWLASDGTQVRFDWQLVTPGSEGSDQFLWATAPAGAASVNAVVHQRAGEPCQIRDVMLQGRQDSDQVRSEAD